MTCHILHKGLYQPIEVSQFRIAEAFAFQDGSQLLKTGSEAFQHSPLDSHQSLLCSRRSNYALSTSSNSEQNNWWFNPFAIILFPIFIMKFISSTHSGGNFWALSASWRWMQWIIVSTRSSDIWSKFTKPFCALLMLDVTSVHSDKSSVVFIPLAFRQLAIASQISCPLISRLFFKVGE